MTDHSSLIDRCTSIIEKEICNLEAKSELTNSESEKVVNYMRVLIAIEKERKSDEAAGVASLSPSELDQEIEREIARIKAKGVQETRKST